MLKKIYCLSLLIITAQTNCMEFNPQDVQRIGDKMFSLIPEFNQVVPFKAPPVIGVYGPGYPPVPQIARIQLDPTRIAWLPPAVEQALPATVPNQNRIFNIVFSHTTPQTYNMMFHSWARTTLPERPRLFNINVLMGIFESDGIQPAASDSISFGSLTSQNVHVHEADPGVLAYSPNNAKFTITPRRDISTFWSVAISPDRQHAIITFHILANTDLFANLIENTVASADTLGAFLRSLYDNRDNLLANRIDQDALQQAITTIEKVIGVPQEGTFAAQALVQSLEDLAESLERLAIRFT